MKNPINHLPGFYVNVILYMMLFGLPLHAFTQYEYEVGLKAGGYFNNGQNPFWFYSNQLGMVSQETQGLGLLDGHYRQYLGERFEVEAGSSLFIDYYEGGENAVRANEYYATLGWNVLRFTAGARGRPKQFLGLSSVNGDILWSNNARAIPGVEVYTSAPFWVTNWLGIEGGMSHYWLNDERFVENPYIHYKFGALNFQLSERSLFKFALHHYAQWGGISPERGQMPNSFGDFVNVFFGKESIDTGAGGPSVALANQMGSWRFHYQYELRAGSLSVYFQNLFENTDGLLFNNFPDGVWGGFWELPENSIIRGIVYEYTHTTGPQKNGNDGGEDYFNSRVYQSGWTYFNRVIGAPYLTPDTDSPGIINNRVTAHHIGVKASVSNLNLKLMGSYATNRGLSTKPYTPFKNVMYIQLFAEYTLWEHLQLGLQLGADLSDVNGENLGAGFSVRYAIGESYRMY
ncbi:capsule assembly Wzi family protein [Robiginitalea aurantiaca]|uniref:Capsule assembly Wzi family protein n=1 Tax=Robiginitalea aurantiaca TaxID=3056915 RepID=A0ABT7WDY3_9FLAO|nr:capsule assembly Wzi family protein [Robiginitalea aurantiaca]MDM9631129.1 capsule assembly Wzi family protein [Robiginitalea aurantiaca]